jgi:hypothetical protein
VSSDEREPVARPPLGPALAAPFLRLLTWYERGGIVRAIVLRVPGGAGAALDATLLATLAVMRRRTAD